MSIVDTAKSGGDFSAMMELLSDPVKLKGEYDRLEAKRRELEDYVALIGPVTDILGARKQAIMSADKAASELVDARDRAQKLIDDARVRSHVIQHEADEFYKAAHEEADTIMKNAKSMMDSSSMALRASEEKLRSVEHAINDRLKRLEEREDAAEAAEQVAQEEAQRFRLAREALVKTGALVSEALSVHSHL